MSVPFFFYFFSYEATALSLLYVYISMDHLIFSLAWVQGCKWVSIEYLWVKFLVYLLY
jgi:hypothetical protein